MPSKPKTSPSSTPSPQEKSPTTNRSSNETPEYWLPIGRPVIRGVLVKRYKRFFADIKLDNDAEHPERGNIITAHCPNTGSMKSCGSAGDHVWVSVNDDPNRKLKFTWEFSSTALSREVETGMIGVNTSRPNAVVFNALVSKMHRELKKDLGDWDHFQREVKYGKNSRIDILASRNDGKRCYIEVKNTTLRDGNAIVFPDAVTERGLKHLEELQKITQEGHEAVAFFLINRPDGEYFAPATHIDPAWSKELIAAKAAGVKVLAYRAINTPTGQYLGGKVPIRLDVEPTSPSAEKKSVKSKRIH